MFVECLMIDYLCTPPGIMDKYLFSKFSLRLFGFISFWCLSFAFFMKVCLKGCVNIASDMEYLSVNQKGDVEPVSII